MMTFNEDFEKIPYGKAPISIKDQVKKLKSRGLIIDDEELAAKFLSNISYYRLRAYTYPFQNNTDPDKDHEFVRKDIHFNDIIALYRFDRRLRFLVFNALEKVEIALRAKITQIYSEAKNDSHWYQDESLFKDDLYLKDGNREFKYNTLMTDIEEEVTRSEEDFIKHYFSRYSEPVMPPSWMTLEVVSFGSLSRLYELFAYLCCIKYFLDIVSPENDFYSNLQALISQGGSLLSLKDMGFPDNWKQLVIWR